MKIAIFTPTCHYGGLDVNAASILRQDYEGDIVWMIGDDLFDLRHDVVVEECAARGIPVLHFKPPARKPGNRRNLATAYNVAIEMSIDLQADIFVSMQDYFWLPPDTISLTVDDLETLEMRHTLTGLASLTQDPGPETVVDLKGLWTIFSEDYTQKPEVMKWNDCRQSMFPANQVSICTPTCWEANYCAFPVDVARRGARYDEGYDLNVAYENQDFAMTCLIRHDAGPHIDTRIHVLGLPHKEYWPEIEAADGPYSLKGRDHHWAKWEPIVGSSLL